MQIGEKINYTGQKYTGLTNLFKHIEYCCATWEACSWQEWVHHFVHTLDMIPRNTSIELRQGTLDWEELANIFTHTFEFPYHHPLIGNAL